DLRRRHHPPRTRCRPPRRQAARHGQSAARVRDGRRHQPGHHPGW
ncbi:hypothetical protein BN1708_019724, partial [Verticillium longisporum]